MSSDHIHMETVTMRETNEYAVDAAALRATGVVALLGIGAIHFLQIVETFQSTPLLGLAYVGLIAASLALAAWLLATGDVRAWAGAGLISAAVIAGYAFTRVVGTTFQSGSHQIEQVLRPGQTSDMRGQDALRAVLHGATILDAWIFQTHR